MPAPASVNWRPALIASLAALVLASGCAQQRSPGYYASNPESTLSDARSQAQGKSSGKAPSQLQLGFGDQKNPQQTADSTPAELADKAAIATTIRPLREAKTFLGTLPCLDGTPGCASRFTLTLAPDGQWRARAQPLAAANGKPTVEQGCWSVTGLQPFRILLRTASDNARAGLTFTNDNVLRVDTLNNRQPTLDYHLTRQPDIDGIDELGNTPTPGCSQ